MKTVAKEMKGVGGSLYSKKRHSGGSGMTLKREPMMNRSARTARMPVCMPAEDLGDIEMTKAPSETP
jgi:hypothetical protein